MTVMNHDEPIGSSPAVVRFGLITDVHQEIKSMVSITSASTARPIYGCETRSSMRAIVRTFTRNFPGSNTPRRKEPLWAFVELDLARGRLIVTGRNSSWVGAAPWEVGVDKKVFDPAVIVPKIPDRALSFLSKKYEEQIYE
jgi:hypothetical protein